MYIFFYRINNRQKKARGGARKKYDIFVCSNFYENVAILKGLRPGGVMLFKQLRLQRNSVTLSRT